MNLNNADEFRAVVDRIDYDRLEPATPVIRALAEKLSPAQRDALAEPTAARRDVAAALTRRGLLSEDGGRTRAGESVLAAFVYLYAR